MLGTIIERYNTIINDYSDPRVNNWFLMSSPIPTLILSLMYVSIVKKIGPWLMRDRKPFEMRKTLIVYNFFQVIISAWIFYEAVDTAWGRDYSFGCVPVDTSTSPIPMRIATASWVYFISKFTEFFDTFFFVMRKRYQQVSALHVIHHGIMPISVWIGVKFTPGGHGTFFALLNTFVHVVMYTYYMLAAFGPQMQKYLWWKKHLTLLQMVQFMLVFIHAANILRQDCYVSPRILTWVILFHAALFFSLFANFYRQAYIKEHKQKAAAAAVQKKKDDEARARSKTATQQDFAEARSLSAEGHPTKATAVYSHPPSETMAPLHAFTSDKSSSLLRNRAFVSFD